MTRGTRVLPALLALFIVAGCGSDETSSGAKDAGSAGTSGMGGADASAAGMGGADASAAGMGGADASAAGMGGADASAAGMGGADASAAGMGGADAGDAAADAPLDVTSEPDALPAPTFSDWPSYGRDHDNSRTMAQELWISPITAPTLSKQWTATAGGVTSTPALRDGIVYYGDWTGMLHAVNALDGAEVWSTQLETDQQINDSPLVTADRVYIGAGGGKLHAVDRATGVEEWSTELDTHPDTVIYSSPAIVGNLVVIGVASIELAYTLTDYTFRGSVMGLDATTGAVEWKTYLTNDDATSGAGVSVWSSAAIDESRKLLYIGSGQSYEDPAGPDSDSLVAIHYETGQIAWVHQFTQNDVFVIFDSAKQGPDFDVGAAPNLFSAGGRDLVGVGDKGGHYYALDRDTGDVVWSDGLTQGSHLGGVMASTAHANGVVYVDSNAWDPASVAVADFLSTTNTNTLFALRDSDGAELWSTQFQYVCLGGIAYANGTLFFTTTEGTLHAVDAQTGSEVWSDALPDTAGGGVTVSGGMVFTGYGWQFFSIGQGATGGVVGYGLP